MRLAKLKSEISCSRIGRYFVVLNPFRGSDQGEVGGSIFLRFGLPDHVVAFFDESCHALAGLRADGSAKNPQPFVEPFGLDLGLREMSLE